MLCKYLLVYGKFKFCFLKLSKGFFFFPFLKMFSIFVWTCRYGGQTASKFTSLKVSTPDQFEVGVPSLQDLMSDDLRCTSNRNKLHNKCNVLESSWNHPLDPTLNPWKSGLPQNWSLAAKKVGDHHFKEKEKITHLRQVSLVLKKLFYLEPTWLSDYITLG